MPINYETDRFYFANINKRQEAAFKFKININKKVNINPTGKLDILPYTKQYFCYAYSSTP